MSARPEFHPVQSALLRAASPARRLAAARSLSATVIQLSRRAIRRRHPDWSERDVLLEFVSIHYGADLAERLRRHLAARTP